MVRSVAVRIDRPRIGTPDPPPCELSVQHVSDFLETYMSKPNGSADLIISTSSSGSKRRRRRRRNKRKRREPLNFSLHSINSDRDLDRTCLVYKLLQYYVGETREKLRRAIEEEEEEVESVRVVLDELWKQLDNDSVTEVCTLMKWKFEYSGDDSLIKSCSVLGSDFSYSDHDIKQLECETEELVEKMQKKLMCDEKGLDYELSEEEIQSAMDPLLHWILACLRLALTFYPLVEDIVREHETVCDVTVTSPGGSAQFHAGRDAIQNFRQRQQAAAAATSTSTVAGSSMIIEKMKTSPFNMKAKMWVVPFLEGYRWSFPTSIFGVATTTTDDHDHDQVMMKSVDAFFDLDPEQTFSSTFFGPNLPTKNRVLEVEMAKIMKKNKKYITTPTAELSVTWLFDQNQAAPSRLRGDYIVLNH